jgi:hypothetical protein
MGKLKLYDVALQMGENRTFDLKDLTSLKCLQDRTFDLKDLTSLKCLQDILLLISKSSFLFLGNSLSVTI